MSSSPQSLRRSALALLCTADPDAKAAGARALELRGLPVGAAEQLSEPPGIPGRPARPELVPHTALRTRSVQTREGHAALLHALAHIEFNAINLALDMAWRFGGMPDAFYRDWLTVAREEALHFCLLRDHLQTLGVRYGDLPAHNALWEMAEKTRGDLLARLALVPRTLEARGLDASPEVKKKLLSAGDTAGADILDIILRDEIGHVAIGNHWYREVCRERGVDFLTVHEQLAQQYRAPRPRGPFNLSARRAAGFDERELAALASRTPAQSH